MKLLSPLQYTIIILYLLFPTSCISTHDDSSLSPVNIEEMTTEHIYYSMFVDSITYLDLEPNELAKLSEVTDVIFGEHYIYILDEQTDKILAYRSDGSFAFIIDKKGKAYDEYINLAQFDFDKENRQLVLLDKWEGNLLVFSEDGRFIRKDSVGRCVSDFKIIPGGYLLSDLGSKDNIAGVFLYDKSQRTIKRLLGNINGIRDNSSFELVSFDDSIGLMTPPFEHKIYHFKKNLENASPFRIIPKVRKKYDYDSGIMEVTDLRKTSYMETRDWILTTYWCYSKGLRTMLYNKTTNTYQVGEKWINDIDNIEPGYKTSNCDNNMFILCDIDDEQNKLTLQFLYLKRTFSPRISQVLHNTSSK